MSNCQVCNNEINLSLIDMGLMPIANDLLHLKKSKSKLYPLQVLLCEGCKLFQLSVRIDPQHIFTDYFYHSSYSSSWLNHARTFAENVKRNIDFNENNFIMEIASNDGYLLKNFNNHKYRILGIEPAKNVAEIAKKNGIPTETIFFNEINVEYLIKKHGKPKLIIANNVLAHVPDLKGFLRALDIIASEETLISIEFPSVANLITSFQFDTIYHEHFTYLSLVTIENLIDELNLKVFKVEKLQTHGGSIRLWITKKSNYFPIDESVHLERTYELNSQIFDKSILELFSKKALNRVNKFNNFIESLKTENLKIYAYGAAAKGISFLNFCGDHARSIQGVFDKNEMKQGCYIPGLNIEILDPKKIEKIRPDYIIILPWNIKEEIQKELSFISHWSGKFITFE
tara:strand:+ start:1789 stop:2988 length:1200 start_codon:yes stop_codon:yes gene_type:complete